MSAVGSPSSDRKRKREDEDASASTNTIVNHNERTHESTLETAITQICSTTTFLQDDFDDMNKEALREILRDSPGALNSFLGGFSSPARKDLSSPKKYLHTVLSAVKSQLNSYAERLFSKYHGLGLDRHHRIFMLKVMRELGILVVDNILRDVSRIFQENERMRNRNAVLMRLLQRFHTVHRTERRLSAVPTDNAIKDFIKKNEHAALAVDRLSNYGGSQLSDSHIEECFARIIRLQGRYPNVSLQELFIPSLRFEEIIIHLGRRPRVLACFQDFLQKQKEFNFDDPRVFDVGLRKRLLSVVDNLNDEQCTVLFNSLDDRFQLIKTTGVTIHKPKNFLMSSLNEMSERIHDDSVGDSLFESPEWKQLQGELSTNSSTEPQIGDRIPREIKRLFNHLVKEGKMSHLRVRGIIVKVLEKLKKPRFPGLNLAHKAVIHFLRSHPQNEYFNKNDSGKKFADICTKMMPALNGKQAEAVDASISSPLLINAGPGTGMSYGIFDLLNVDFLSC
ncbi:hypothetical protein BKA69DRAFT_63146 [Paraphysoderma sedebokerense]|nr:hypothetical protein BKA69DRAFT_63146 [Paraphysoderma sedebokerense]